MYTKRKYFKKAKDNRISLLNCKHRDVRDILHKLNLLIFSAQIKHNWFLAKNKIKKKFPFDFPEKDNILSLLFKIEEMRNLLCYSKRQPEAIIEKNLLLLEEMKTLMKKLGVEYE